MALKMSALFTYKFPLCTGPLSRVTANFHGAGAKLKHILSPGSQQFIKKHPTSLCGHFNIAPRGENFSKTAALWTPSQGSGSSVYRDRRGFLGKLALGAAAGLSIATLVQSLHTGAVTAMALRINLNSAEGDWKKIKEFLLSRSVEERREYYRTSSFVPLDDIPAWTPTAGASEQPIYKRNENLDQKISLYSGDITKLEIDAIVNAANRTLLGGGGVDGAIHRAAGPVLVKECASLQGCETGQAKITCGYGLPAKYVIHTVGPIAQGRVGDVEKEALRSCYRNSLNVATQHAARSVAFPCISTGIYGYPPEEAVHEALATVREYLDEHHEKLDRVIFCVFLPSDKKLYLQNLPLYFPAATLVCLP